MGEIAEAMTKRKKKKGRPSLLELQKRSLKQEKLQLQQQLQPHQNPNLKNPNSLNANAGPNRRSTRRSANHYAPEWIGSDDDEDERKEKKHKCLVGLNSRQLNNHYPVSSANSLGPQGSDSNAADLNSEADLTRSKIRAGRLGSDEMVEKVSKATDAPCGSSVEPGPTTPLPDKKLLVFILDRLQKKDTYGVFSDPVDPEELPDYHDIIEHPMDFSTARKKLDEGAYVTLEQFEKDVFLICSNAMQYNSPDTIYFRQARSMQELAKKDFENLRQDSDDSEPQPKVARRGRPPGKLKRSLEGSHFHRVGPEFSSDATLASGGDNTSLSNGYNLRKTTSYKYHPADAMVRAFHGSQSSENYASWLTELENEFPASVLKAVLKYGKKPFAVDENRRDTYKHSFDSMHEPSVLNTFDGELKQLLANVALAVGLNSEHGYARSLARFAAGLGPIVWKIASKNIARVLPMGIEFGPGWVGENNAVQGQEFSSSNKQISDKQKALNHSLLDDHLFRVQSLSTAGTNSTVTSRYASWSREDMVDHSRGLSSQSELTSLKSSVAGIKPVPSVLMQQKPAIPSDMTGFSGGFVYNGSAQMEMGRLVMPKQRTFGMVSTGNNTFIPTPGNDFNSNQAGFAEISSGLLHTGSSSALGSNTDSHTLYNAGLVGKSSWQGLSPYHQQDLHPVPPDLNVRFLAPNSPSSSVPIGSPQQPDLALQL